MLIIEAVCKKGFFKKKEKSFQYGKLHVLNLKYNNQICALPSILMLLRCSPIQHFRYYDTQFIKTSNSAKLLGRTARLEAEMDKQKMKVNNVTDDSCIEAQRHSIGHGNHEHRK